LMSGCISQYSSHFDIYPIKSHFGGHTVYDVIRWVERAGDYPMADRREDLLERVDMQIAGLNKAWEFVATGFAELQTIAIPEQTIPKSFLYRHEGD
ncbi:MAG TPA: hypothetical protein VD994_11810, partial [Prosthecobacter sp.]|nr:hypothetical protein [Prosthecobacter sp.]